MNTPITTQGAAVRSFSDTAAHTGRRRGQGSLGVVAILAGALAVTTLTSSGAQTGKLKTIASFCGEVGCTDGASPASKLTMDASGRLYGVTELGGNSNLGVVYEIAPPSGDRGRWKLNTIHKFALACGDEGCEPSQNTPIIDLDGNLYGSAYLGGTNGFGTVYKLAPNARHTEWTFETLYSFGGGLGQYPQSPLTYQGAANGSPYDGKSSLYGTTFFGGAHIGCDNVGDTCGVVYRLVREHGAWTEKDLYSFCAAANCADGAFPQGPLLLAPNGHLFGTTRVGGQHNSGVVFELVDNGGSWSETVLHSFCEAGNCGDSPASVNGVIMDAAGALYGTTASGGAHGAGVVYKLVPNGAKSEYTELYDFCARRDCKDGSIPDAELFLDSSGNLYGVTTIGGRKADGDDPGAGIVFKLSGTTMQVLYRFCARDGCADGKLPRGGLIMDSAGHLFGTTSAGGKFGDKVFSGTVFEFTP